MVGIVVRRRFRRVRLDGVSGLGASRPKEFVPRKLYRIGDVMRYTGLSRQMIHNYTMLRLIREEERTDAGHRLYGEDVFERLARIQELKDSKTLREIQEIFLAEEMTQRGRQEDPRPRK